MPDAYQPLDLTEKGKNKAGEPTTTNRRLFMQLLAFGNITHSGRLIEALDAAGIEGVLYHNLNDPRGVALLTFHENPDHFVTEIRAFLNESPFADLTPKPEYTMFGRTYSIGYERDLEHHLLVEPKKKLCDPAQPWAVWYPLRRYGTFDRLSQEEQFTLLREHGSIGRAYGAAGYGTDIRLACYGLDQHDNDFVIALLGPELFPLSSIVQAMRKTGQTSEHMQKMGPFFVGKVVWAKMHS